MHQRIPQLMMETDSVISRGRPQWMDIPTDIKALLLASPPFYETLFDQRSGGVSHTHTLGAKRFPHSSSASTTFAWITCDDCGRHPDDNDREWIGLYLGPVYIYERPETSQLGISAGVNNDGEAIRQVYITDCEDVPIVRLYETHDDEDKQGIHLYQTSTHAFIQRRKLLDSLSFISDYCASNIAISNGSLVSDTRRAYADQAYKYYLHCSASDVEDTNYESDEEDCGAEKWRGAQVSVGGVKCVVDWTMVEERLDKIFRLRYYQSAEMIDIERSYAD